MILRSTLRPFAASIARPLSRHQCKRTLVAAPKTGDGPLMTRRADRALPSIANRHVFLRTMPLFLLVVGASTLAIFNYQKSSSSVVTSSLYALRTNPRAREVLGEEIYFASKMPWIWGHIDQMHGSIDVRFGVKGTRGRGEMRFVSERKTKRGFVCGHMFCGVVDVVLMKVYSSRRLDGR
jgi:cytochrome c oxidase assembly factor 1